MLPQEHDVKGRGVQKRQPAKKEEEDVDEMEARVEKKDARREDETTVGLRFKREMATGEREDLEKIHTVKQGLAVSCLPLLAVLAAAVCSSHLKLGAALHSGETTQQAKERTRRKRERASARRGREGRSN